MTVTLTATVQDVWPPRVALAVAGLTLGDDLILYRSSGGTRTAVRGGTVTGVTDTGLSAIDAELPFGVPVTYIATVNAVDVATDGPATYELPGGKVAVSDAIIGLAAEVMILAPLQAKTWDPQATTFKAGGRNIVVAAGLGQYTTSYDLFVAAASSADTLETLLRNATEGTVLIRQPGGYPGIDAHVAILGVDENPVTDDGMDERRVFTVAVAQVEPWSDGLPALGYTYGDWDDAYSELTYADADADYPTYLDARVAEPAP